MRNALTIVLSLSVAFGCSGPRVESRKPPEAPQYASIRAACLEHKKDKDSGALQVPIEREAKALRMSVDLWGNYEYARKELAKAAVTITEIRTIAAVDLEVAEGRVYEAQAQRDRYKAQRWYFGAGGVAVGVVLAVLVGFALR